MPKYVMIDSHILPGARYDIEEKILGEAGIECIIAECKTDDEIVALCADAEAVGLLVYPITAQLMDRLPKLKTLVRYGIGVDTIDIAAATERGIMVCNLPDYCLEDVASHALSLFLGVLRKTTLFDRIVRTGVWNNNDGYRVHRVSNMTIGTVGIGNIARHFIKYVKPFGPRVISYDPYAPDSLFEQVGAERVTFEELIEQSDAISIHVPLTEETRHLFNKEIFKKMKNSCLLVNTARGPIVSQDDLVWALKSGEIMAAGMDVMEREPLTDLTDECFELDNLILTPHSAYNSIEAEIEQHEKVAISVVEIVGKGSFPYNVFNRKGLLAK
ncbi:MAG: C-terminal binding protein [Oscillospiraceae bacterium]